MDNKKRDWWHEVSEETPQQEIRRIFREASKHLRWGRGWRTVIKRELGVSDFHAWLKGDREYNIQSPSGSEKLRTIRNYVNLVLPYLLPAIAKYCLWAFNEDAILVTGLEDTVDHVVEFLSQKEGVAVLEDGANVLGILTADDIRRDRDPLGLWMSKKPAVKAPKKSLKDLYHLDKLCSMKGTNLKIVQWEYSIDDVLSDLKKYDYILVKEQGKIIRVIPERPKSEDIIRGIVEEYAEVYALSCDLPWLAASCLVRLIPKKKFKKGMKALDVAFGSGAGSVALKLRVKKILGEDACVMTAADDEREKEFERILPNVLEKHGLSNIKLSLVPDGRINLVLHGKDFDVVLFNCIAPEKGAINQFPSILAKNGTLAISYYDKETLKDLYTLVIDAFQKQYLYLELPKDGMFDLLELKNLVSNNKKLDDHKFKWVLHQKEFDGHFSTPRIFIQFLYCAFPFTAGCFSLLERNQEAKQRVWSYLEKKIAREYGSKEEAKRESNHVAVPFIMNFVVGSSR